MHETYSLGDIETATGIPYEKLRYVVDQGLLPGDRPVINVSLSGSRGRGTARRYTPFVAFGIASAALLLAAGLRRAMVEAILDRVCNNSLSKRGFDSMPLYQAYQKRDVSILEIGDLVNWRIRGSADLYSRTFDTGWQQVHTGDNVIAYEPLVTISLDTAKLRRFFLK
ncbi:MAG: hypothetical protein R3C01_12760 [Planctomycetaceae bacterium]